MKSLLSFTPAEIQRFGHKERRAIKVFIAQPWKYHQSKGFLYRRGNLNVHCAGYYRTYNWDEGERVILIHETISNVEKERKGRPIIEDCFIEYWHSKTLNRLGLRKAEKVKEAEIKKLERQKKTRERI